jgi:ribonuclease HI
MVAVSMDTEKERKMFLEKSFTISTAQLQELIHISHQIAQSQSFTAYTDGSLTYTNSIGLMGIGWILKDNRDNEYQFQAQLENFPSSTRAEIMAIATVISTIPRNSKILIHTDSQGAIQAISNFQNTRLKSHSRKFRNGNILAYISEVIRQKDIQISLNKVAAHTGIVGNEKADRLASIDKHNGMKPREKLLSIITANIDSIQIKPIWKNTPIDCPLPTFCKTIFKAKRLAQWRLLNRSRQWLNTVAIRDIDWQATFHNLHPSPINNGITTREDHQQRRFNLNLWNDELPTKSKLHKRSPTLYKNNRCHKCKEMEDTSHPFICNNKLESTREKLLNLLIFMTKKHSPKEIGRAIVHDFQQKSILNHDHQLKQAIHGVVHKDTVQIIDKYTKNKANTRKCITEAYREFKKYLLTIWTTRCENFIEWEKENKITTKDKKKNKKKYDATPLSSELRAVDNYYKDQFVDLTNKFIDSHIKGNTNFFSILRFNLSSIITGA